MSFAVKMLEMLTSAYNRTDLQNFRENKPPETNIGKLFALSGWGFDILKEQTEKVRLWDRMDKMQGTSLDNFGRNYGVVRGEASDEMYRVMIKVKILAMMAAGNMDTIILSAASLFGVSASDVTCEEVFPAKVYLYIDEDKLDQEHKDVANIIANLMCRIKSAGIGIRIFYQTYHGARLNVYLATNNMEIIRLQVQPESGDKYLKYEINFNAGVPMLERIAVHFTPAE
ncbi:hypothetical protein NQ487_19795 [Hungatella hathewayi]|uniref:Uncharacterized protein n=1 Tax=Hungatella hathewayi DSM 13479 TaxID=566550 RepID=D3ALQ3_9FIRM|nr:hypothetical protein [Hungatella hathewayi]EFC97251.1 hypothetical protein CLOSTHATH_04549 [Hungatella hathewayi DSM 13479]UWO83113.1 hypothetical protein NQ487_19795 [Hungatella hathewayi]